MTKIASYLVGILICSLTGCIGAVTIQGYQYPIKKDSLQTAIMSVIKNNPNIFRDTSLDSLGSSPMLDHRDGEYYSAGKNYYNDIKHYVTIKITFRQQVNEYVFKYYGPDEDWKTSPTSKIFICYINHNKESNGMIFEEKAKYFTDIFENEFVNKIDKELNLPHTTVEE